MLNSFEIRCHLYLSIYFWPDYLYIEISGISLTCVHQSLWRMVMSAWFLKYFQPFFYFKVLLILNLKWIACRSKTGGFCFSVHSIRLCILIREFWPLIFKVLIERCLLIVILMMFCWFVFLVVVCFSLNMASFIFFLLCWLCLVLSSVRSII